MANARRFHATTQFASCGRGAKIVAFLFAGFASAPSIAATSCGREEPTDRPSPSLSRQSAAGNVDTTNGSNVACAGIPICCVGRGARCGGAVDCCSGTACVAMADGYFRCAVPCSFDSDCRSGCCAPASPDGDLVCAVEPCCGVGAVPCST